MKTVALLSLIAFLSLGFAQSEQDPAQIQQDEESQDHFKKWLLEDVLYIITPEEKGVFQKLTTEDEKINFIEQFWRRRDPTPHTEVNEFREEHYYRIAYANANFTSGFPGWKTDRGMVYIKMGPPTEIERNPSGGTYHRTSYEGGGSTATYPFERWYYRNIDDFGGELELEFVDKSMSGEYKLAMHADEKDAFLNVPNQGQTYWEFTGFSNKRERNLRMTNRINPFMSPGDQYTRVQDLPFEKIQTLVKIQQAPPIKFTDLQALVTSEITYDDVSFRVDTHVFRISQDLYLVPVTLEIANKDLLYRGMGEVQEARLNIYGELKNVAGRLAGSFEESMVLQFGKEELRSALNSSSLYQKKLFLSPGRFLLNAVVRDEYGESIGTQQKLIVVESVSEELAASTPLLASRIVGIGANFEEQFADPFVLSGYKVYPSVNQEFSAGQDLLVYFQIYNFDLDQASLKPDVEIDCQILNSKGQLVSRIQTPNQLALAESRIEAILVAPLEETLPKGRYQLKVSVRDKVLDKTTTSETTFSLIS